MTSTPGPSALASRKYVAEEPACSEISSGSKISSKLSGIQDISKDFEEDMHVDESEKSKMFQKSRSFIDPLELSIDITEVYQESDCESDQDYVPSFDITLVPSTVKMENIEEGDLEDELIGLKDEPEFTEGEEDQPDIGPGVRRIYNPEDGVGEQVYMVYEQSLLHLAKHSIHMTVCSTKGCNENIDIVLESIGSAVYLKWICKNKHLAYRWCSQPLLNRRLHLGDLNTSSAILLSGNNFAKISLMSKFLNLKIVSKSTFMKIQRHYLVGCIEEFWNTQQADIVQNLQEIDVVLLGDGRNDSPGFSSQYCTYTMMENESKTIVSVTTIDKRETERKSTNMEKAGFERSMQLLQRQNVEIKEVVTDTHTQISAAMKRNYPGVKHSYDIWHSAKNLGKKIIAAGQQKGCGELLKWSADVVNHFWFCCQKADSYEEFLGMWSGVLHHVVNEHEWLIGNDLGPNYCLHGPLTDVQANKTWLKKGSAPHRALREIIFSKYLLRNVPYFLNFRSTAELENFHNHILMYAAKRFACTPPVYKARNLLAAIDYNFHLDREFLVNKDGNIVYHRLFNKKSGRWTVVPKKIEKSYRYIPTLMKLIIGKRLEDKEGMQGQVVLSATDPRRIAANIAPVPPPETLHILQEKKSRMN